MTTELIAERIVELLRDSLRAQRISQTRLASELGLTQQAVSRRLTGDVPFSLTELEITAGVLGTSLTAVVSAASVSPDAAGVSS